MKPVDLAAWVVAAEPGDRVVYHHGDGRTLRKTPTVKQARALYDQGLIDMAQVRSGAVFDYLAIKRRRAATIDPAFSFAKCLKESGR